MGFDREGVLRLFGTPVPSSGLFPYLLLLLALLFLTLFAASALGRLWCGWLCPQSVFADLSARIGSGWGLALVSLFLAVSSAIYYMPVGDFFSDLASFNFGYPHYYALAVWILLYLDMAYVGRRFCRSICPYGKVLGLLADRDVVGVRFDLAREGLCKGCDRCVRVCPMGLDVRAEASPECIACGRCVDACAGVFEKSHGRPLIGFMLPEGGWLRGVAGRPRNFALLAATLLALGLFAATLGSRSGVNFAVRINSETPPRTLVDGRLAVFVTAHLSGKAGVYSIAARYWSGEAGDLRGEATGLALKGGDSREARFALVLGSGEGGRVDFILLDGSGGEVARATLDTARLEGAR